MCAKFKVDRLSHFRTGTRQMFTSQKPFPSEIPLTIKSATHFLIKLPYAIFLLKFYAKQIKRQINQIDVKQNYNRAKKVSICAPLGYFPFLFHFFVKIE